MDLLAFLADQHLIGNEIQGDQVFSSACLLCRCESRRRELRYLIFQFQQVIPAFFLTLRLEHRADEGEARAGFPRIRSDDLALEGRIQQVFQRFRSLDALRFKFLFETGFIVADGHDLQVRAVPVAVLVLIFRLDHLRVRRLVRFRQAVRLGFRVGIARAAQPDIRFRRIFLRRDARQRFAGGQTDEAHIRAGLLFELIGQLLCRVLMERHIHDELLAFQILAAFRLCVRRTAASRRQRDRSREDRRRQCFPFHTYPSLTDSLQICNNFTISLRIPARVYRLPPPIMQP